MAFLRNVMLMYMFILIIIATNIGTLLTQRHKHLSTQISYVTVGAANAALAGAVLYMGYLLYSCFLNPNVKTSQKPVIIILFVCVFMFLISAATHFWGYGPNNLDDPISRWAMGIVNSLAAIVALLMLIRWRCTTTLK